MLRTATVITITILLLGASQLFGDGPSNPPDWWTHNDGVTTALSYHFDTGAWPPTAEEGSFKPDDYDAPTFTRDDDFTWRDNPGDHQGCWYLPPGQSEASFGAIFDNHADPMSKKEVFLQFVYQLDDAGLDEVAVWSTDETNVVRLGDPQIEDMGANWKRYTVRYELTPQPPYEKCYLWFSTAATGGVYIDEFHFGAHCRANEDHPHYRKPVAPPDWWGQPDPDGKTVSVSYNFDTEPDKLRADPYNIIPAGFGNVVWELGSWFWTEGDEHRSGRLQSLNGPANVLKVTFPNEENTDNVKEVWIQFVYRAEGLAEWCLPTPPGTFKTYLDGSTEQLKNGWIRVTQKYMLCPQPAWERFEINPVGIHDLVVLDQLHFGSHCQTGSSGLEATCWGRIKSMYE